MKVELGKLCYLVEGIVKNLVVHPKNDNTHTFSHLLLFFLCISSVVNNFLQYWFSYQEFHVCNLNTHISGHFVKEGENSVSASAPVGCSA